MRKAALCISIVLMIPLCAATSRAGGWLDIFSNAQRDEWCIYPSAGTPYVQIEIYFYAIPPGNGFRATECAMPLPDPALSISTVRYHPNMNLAFGDWSTGMSLSFDMCMTDQWVLCATISLLAFPPGLSPGCQVMKLEPRYDSRFFGFATCGSGFPQEEADHQVDVYINCEPCPYDGPTEASWGAIKNLYDD
jgi:hypothetical protein